MKLWEFMLSTMIFHLQIVTNFFWPSEVPVLIANFFRHFSDLASFQVSIEVCVRILLSLVHNVRKQKKVWKKIRPKKFFFVGRQEIFKTFFFENSRFFIQK